MSARAYPLNGHQTHPLTEHGWSALRALAAGPQPQAAFNAGIVDRLTREPEPLARARAVRVPSPYKKDRGGTTRGLEITAAGRLALQTREEKP